MGLEELRAEQTLLATEIRELSDKDDATDDDVTTLDGKLVRYEEVLAAIAPLEERAAKVAKVQAAAQNPKALEGEKRDAPNVNLNKSVDLFDLSGIEHRAGTAARGAELRSRVEKFVEDAPSSVTDDQRANIIRLTERAGAGFGQVDTAAEIAEHVLKFGSPSYERAFYKVLQNPQAGMLTLNEEERAAMAEGTTTTGGFMVPVLIDPTIILTNNGTTNPFRSIATVKTITTQTWKGVTSAGVTAEWTAEAAEATDASPTIAQPTITPVRADAWVQASFEMLEDTDISSELAMLFADARDRLESAAFATGTGSTQPTGIVTALQAVTASRVASNTNAAYGAVDIYALDAALPPRHRNNASWMANKSLWNLTRQFATGSGPQSAFWADFGSARPPSLIGYPVYESSEMFNAPLSGATASSDDIVILGDFRKYYIIDRIGASVQYEPLVKGPNRRPTGEVGWFLFWRVGGNVVDANAFRMLRA